MSSAVVVGAGLFGLATARSLRSRGFGVTLVDPGPVPHPDAASTDASKVVRADYGSDELYTELAERALDLWPEWNELLGEPVYHPDGFLMMTRAPFEDGGFEADSYRLLASRGFPVERIDAATLARRFPAWGADGYVDGYFNPRAGWVESGRANALIAERAREEGVELELGVAFERVLVSDGRASGVACAGGRELEGDLVVVAAGAWTPVLVPELADRMWATAQPVMHFQVDDPTEWAPPEFPVWGADVAATGWYGFPALPDGQLKVANHGPGWRVDARGSRKVPAGEEERFRRFLAGTFPGAAGRPIVDSHLCLYCDTFDGHYWIDRHPEIDGLVVAAGGSGHGFKFAPVIGDVVADACEGRANPVLERFRWRESTGSATPDGMRAVRH